MRHRYRMIPSFRPSLRDRRQLLPKECRQFHQQGFLPIRQNLTNLLFRQMLHRYRMIPSFRPSHRLR
jgi:hypothetical protein